MLTRSGTWRDRRSQYSSYLDGEAGEADEIITEKNANLGMGNWRQSKLHTHIEENLRDRNTKNNK